MMNFFKQLFKRNPQATRANTTVRDSAGTVRSFSSIEDDARRMQARNNAIRRGLGR